MKKYEIRRTQGKRRLGLITAGIVGLALFAWLGSYPQSYNLFAGWLAEKTPLVLPNIPQVPLTLGLDLQSGVHLSYEADMASIPESDRKGALEGVRDVIERRINAFGVAEPQVQTTTSGGYRVLVDLPGVTDAQEAVQQIGETPVLEFKVAKKDFTLDPNEEELARIEAAQETERATALDVLSKARARNADFAALAQEYSIDVATKDVGGYVGFISERDEEYGGLATRISEDRLRPGVIDGLYEGTSRMHIVRYLQRADEQKVQASHILICYLGAKGCSSNISRAQAEEQITSLRDQATPQNFSQLADQYSDDPSNQGNGGSLGWVYSGQMVPAFNDALFAMSNGQISNIVETDFGYHLIYRTDSQVVPTYEIAHIEMPWTTASDIVSVDPWENTGLSGKHLKNAVVAANSITGAPYVAMEFNEEGGVLFEGMTRAHVGEVIGIFLDGEPITTPVVEQVITRGSPVSITGDFTINDAKLLAQRLTAGALPVPITLISQQTIGPTLGFISLNQSVYAGLIGFALIALFMIAYYRLPGLCATIALAIYAGLNIVLYKWFGVTLTLAGIAGLVLSLGIAVDANVLVYERLKEELRAGRDLPSALQEAYRRAWPSIRDGNFTTLIATSILYAMSSGFIRGFALTLTIGVLLSMFTALMITRGMLQLVAHRSFFRKRLFFLGL